MTRPRGSIAGLLFVIALMSVGFAALKVSSRLWAATFLSFTVLCLVGAIAGLIYRRGRARAGCVGFALFGWSYLLVVLGPPPLNVWKDGVITAPVLAVLEDQLLEPPVGPTRNVAPSRPGMPAARTVGSYVELTPWTHWTATDRSNPFSNDSFQRIGHSLFCLAIAAIGGAFCWWLHDTNSEAPDSI